MPDRTEPIPLRTILVAGLVLLALIGGAGACSSEKEPVDANPNERGGTTTKGAARLDIELPDGKSDRFGPLPEEVVGWKVSRGAAAGYVDDKACKDCHQDIWDTYQEMGMARSFYPPTESNVVEDLGKPYFQKRTKRYYVMHRRDGKLWQARYMLDRQGRKYAEYEAEVQWIIGSGNHVRTYLSQTEWGELFEMPLSWYAKVGWQMSPGYETNNSRFERSAGRDCIFCHNALPETPVGSDLDHKPFTFPKNMPHGIGCQRCHGPGARHVKRAADEDATDEQIREVILNPARFTSRQRDELCMTCHLQSDSSGDFLPRRFTQTMYGHRPDDEVSKTFIHLDHGTEAERRNRIQVNHHGYRLRWSKCHTESNGKMTCVTCHDPHKKVPKKERPAYYRKKCFECHQLDDCQMEGMGTDQDPAKADCVSCHMFEARPKDVVHVTITDHLIRRRPPKRDLVAPMKEPEIQGRRFEIVPYFPDRDLKDPKWEVYAGFGTLSGNCTEDDRRRWVEAFERTRPHTVAAYIWVGRRLMDDGDLRRALAILAEGASLYGDVEEMLWAYGECLWSMNKSAEAIVSLEKAVAIRPEHPGIQRSLADAYSLVRDWSKARAAYERSLKKGPVNWRTWRHYANCLVQIGDKPAAIVAFGRAIALNPDDGFAFRSRARLYGELAKHAEMLRVLEQGGSHLFEVKLDLVGQYLLCDDPKLRKPELALELAAEAAREQPKSGRPRLHLALAKALLGKVEGLPDLVADARKKGADPACCTAVQFLYRMRLNDEEGALALKAQLNQELRQQSKETLRPLILQLFQSPR